MVKKVIEFYDKVGQRYADWQETHYLNFSSLFDEISWLQFSEFLPEEVDATILDAGCGGGGWSLRLAKMGYRALTLLDISPKTLAAAERLFSKHDFTAHAQFIVADLENGTGLEDASFDFVLCERDPLEYCVDRQDEAFAELARVLRPGGTLTLSAGTAYFRKQRLLKAGRFDEFFEAERTGVFDSEEGPLRPFSVARVEELFAAHNIEKIKIAGRLTVTDLVGENDWAEIYKQPELRAKLLETELEYNCVEHLADASSHLFAAGRKGHPR